MTTLRSVPEFCLGLMSVWLVCSSQVPFLSFLKIGTTLALLQSSGTSSISHDSNKIMDSGSESSSASSFSTLECCSSSPGDCGLQLQSYSPLPCATNLLVCFMGKDWNKIEIEYLCLFFVLCYNFSISIAQLCHYVFSLSFATHISEECFFYCF